MGTANALHTALPKLGDTDHVNRARWLRERRRRAGGRRFVSGIAKTKAIDTIESGPILGIHASAYLAKAYGFNDVIAMDIGGTTAKVSVLRNGEPIVFLPAEFKSPLDPRKTAERWAAYLAWYSSELRKDGLDLVVLLVPNRPTIYAPLLAEPRDVSASIATLDDLAAALQSAGVRTVPLEHRYAQDASTLLSQKKYLYFLDDTHWNGDGTAIAAEEIFSHRN